MEEKSKGLLGTAVVTGASSGLGKVYAARLAERAYDLLLIARRKDRLETIAADLQSRFTVQVAVLEADLTQPEALAGVFKRLSEDSSISMLVNNAGTSSVQPFAQSSIETIKNLVALNATALTVLTTLCCQIS